MKPTSFSASERLFQPVKVGNISLSHRVVLAPLTRVRNTVAHEPTESMVTYYSQRATSGGLLISEATDIAFKAGGTPHAPGIYTDKQISQWKKITDAVHGKGSYIFLQIWAFGRISDSPREPGCEVVGPSDVPLTGHAIPRALEISEIEEYVQLFATAAKNAVEKAGFDGVEVHAANGYLLDEFLHEGVNVRTDRYGGSAENRSRFTLEVVDAVSAAVGPERVGIRISPWGSFQGMGLSPKAVIEQYTDTVTSLRERQPSMAYIHVVDPRSNGAEDKVPKPEESNEFIRQIWAPRPIISAGGFSPASALEHAATTGDLVAFGRHYIANPDLVRKLKENKPLTPYNRMTFYLFGDQTGTGYTDYPFWEDEVAVGSVQA